MKEITPVMSVYIVYRDIRTYSERELLYKKARDLGVVFIRYDLDHKPEVTETDDGRYLITLSGVCRFDVAEEITVTTPYRQVIGQFDRWLMALGPEEVGERQLRHLLACRLDELLVAIAERRAPKARHALDVAFSMFIVDVDAFTSIEDRRPRRRADQRQALVDVLRRDDRITVEAGEGHLFDVLFVVNPVSSGETAINLQRPEVTAFASAMPGSISAAQVARTAACDALHRPVLDRSGTPPSGSQPRGWRWQRSSWSRLRPSTCCLASARDSSPWGRWHSLCRG